MLFIFQFFSFKFYQELYYLLNIKRLYCICNSTKHLLMFYFSSTNLLLTYTLSYSSFLHV